MKQTVILSSKFSDFLEKPKKVNESVKMLIINAIILAFLASVLFTFLVPPGQKKEKIKKFSAGTCRSFNPTMRECQKTHLILKFPDVKIPFLQKIQRSIFPSSSQSKALYMWKNFSSEKSLSLILASEFLESEHSEKCIYDLVHLDSQSDFLR